MEKEKVNFLTRFFQSIAIGMKKIGRWFLLFGQIFIKGDILTKLSFFIMGLSNLLEDNSLRDWHS